MVNLDSIRLLLRGNFLSSMAILAPALGYSRSEIAEMLHSGRSVELARNVAEELGARLRDVPEEDLQHFIRSAESFTPPEGKELLQLLMRSARSRRPAAGEDSVPLPHQPPLLEPMALFTRAVRLSAAMGYPPRIVARIVYAGRFSSLVKCLAQDARIRASRRFTEDLRVLLTGAESFALPERFIREPELLARRAEHIAGRR